MGRRDIDMVDEEHKKAPKKKLGTMAIKADRESRLLERKDEVIILTSYCFGSVRCEMIKMYCRCSLLNCTPILSYPILSYHILPYPILHYPILSYPTLSYPILHYPILPYPHYPILSYNILSCHILATAPP